MGFQFQVGMGWDGNGNEVIEMGGNWDQKKSIPHISTTDHRGLGLGLGIGLETKVLWSGSPWSMVRK